MIENERKNNLSIRRIGQRWEATRAPRWTRKPQAGVRSNPHPGMPTCGIDPNAINPISLKPESALAARRQNDIPAEPVQSDVTVISKGKIVGRGDVYLRPTLEGIESGKIKPRDIFQNRPVPGKTTPELPVKPPGYYEEFVHPTPGVSGAGPQRIVRGAGGEMYYTPDHYDTFVPLN